MNYLLNIYEFGLIVKTEIHTNEKSALKAFDNHLQTIEGDFEKGVCFCSCTPTAEEANAETLIPDEVNVVEPYLYVPETPAPKKKK
jgi:hypothetical protein